MQFNKPPYTGNEDQFVLQALRSGKMSGDGEFTNKCQTWFEKNLPCTKSLLTPSCTAALEMAAILLGIKAGDEVIMPSYTFVSTANAFVLRGAKIVFVDIKSDTMNIDETKIEAVGRNSENPDYAWNNLPYLDLYSATITIHVIKKGQASAIEHINNTIIKNHIIILYL